MFASQSAPDKGRDRVLSSGLQRVSSEVDILDTSPMTNEIDEI